MATLRYFWHGFIHRDTTDMYIQYNRPPYLSPFTKCLEGVVHQQRVHLGWSSVLTSLQDGYVHLLCSTRSFAVVLSLWRIAQNRMDSYRVNTVDVPVSHPCHRRKKSVTAADVWLLAMPMKNDGVLYHQVSSFSSVSMRLRSLLQGERTTARDPVKHKRWIYSCNRAAIRNINKDGRADGVRCLPNIWLKVINKGPTILAVYECCTVPLWIKPCQKYWAVAITLYSTLVLNKLTFNFLL